MASSLSGYQHTQPVGCRGESPYRVGAASHGHMEIIAVVQCAQFAGDSSSQAADPSRPHLDSSF